MTTVTCRRPGPAVWTRHRGGSARQDPPCVAIRAALAILLTLAALQTPAAEQAAPAQGPTFKAGVELVEIDAIVTDSQGTVVTDLTAADFDIREDGRPQTVAAVSLVNVPIERADRPLYSPAAVEPDVQTNTRGEGRLYVLALDDVSPFAAARARIHLRRFVERELGENDLAAVVLLGNGRRADAQDFTNNRRLLLRAIDRYAGVPSEMAAGTTPTGEPAQTTDGVLPPSPFAPDMPSEFIAVQRMTALRELMEFMGTVRGRRKAVLLLSEGLGVNMFNVIDTAAASTTSRAGDIAREAMRAALRANVAVYPIDPRGVGADAPDGGAEAAPTAAQGQNAREARDSLRALADVTGGFALVNTNSFDAAFDRIVRENSTYYILGYYPTNERRDGRYRRLSVRVKRPGLQVRSRDGYLAPTGRAPAAASTARDLSPAVAEALASPMPLGGVPMAVAAAAYKGDNDNAAVGVAVEIAGSGLDLVEKEGVFTGRVELVWAAANATGKVFPGDRTFFNLSLKPDTYARVRESGLRVLLEPQLPPGRYQLRVAAGNTGGRAGSVVYDLEIPEFTKAPLVMSGVAVTSMQTASIYTARPKDPLRGVLPGPITATREFRSGDRLAVFAEVYPNLSGAAHMVDLKAELRVEGGTVVRTVAEQRSSSEIPARGAYGFLAELPLDDVAPGLYVIRVEARANVGNRPVASRDVLIRVR